MKIKSSTKLSITFFAASLVLTAFGWSSGGSQTFVAPAQAATTFAADDKTGAKLTAAEKNGTYQIDPAHSEISFRIRHMGLSEVFGEFGDYSGAIEYDADDVTKSKVEFVAKINSINTNVKQRDDHLRNADFFDAEKFPEMTFRSKRIEAGKTPNQFTAIGDFTLKGVTKEIRLPVEFYGVIKDMYKNTRMGASARLEINRQDYGVKWSQALDNGSLVVDNTVRVELQLEAVKQEAKKEIAK